MLHIALCDDQDTDREQIKQLVDRWLQQNHISASISLFEDGASLLSHMEERHNIDLLLLDVIMPGENGIETGQKLRRLSRDTLIIYLTSSVDYALDAYDVRPLHYLVKPVVPSRLYDTLDEARSILQRRREDSILVRASSGEIRLVISDILYAELKDRKVHYHLCSGNTIESVSLRVSFSEAVAELLTKPSFVLSGASYAVNLEHVRAVDRSELLLTGNERLTLPKKAQTELKAAWMKYWLEGGL